MRVACVAGLLAKLEEEWEAQKRNWEEHSRDLTFEAMMLDSRAADLDKEERLKVASLENWPRQLGMFLLFRYCLYFLHMKENGYEEDEVAEIKLQREQHVEEQQSSLAAVDEALAVDASNADLLEVRTRLSVFVPERVARPRLPESLSGPD
ncbi:hypothetical protein ZWY2020_028475 [Hordeum vulgare]|nr:hypothetical protein ZWY2020_028475 [Hordeum vulgare]